LTHAVPVPHANAAPQPPQFVLLVRMFVSQPSVCLLLLQSLKPALHVPLQTLAAHVTVAIWFGEHTVPQAPQLLGLFARFDSHPSVCLFELQSPNPALQVPLHVPLHVTVVMLLAEHAFPQPPQLFVSVFVLDSHPLNSLLLSQSA
jgi:hypothetical protein